MHPRACKARTIQTFVDVSSRLYMFSNLVHSLIYRNILGPSSSYVQAKATSLDPDNKKIMCESIFDKKDFELDYDKLVIAVGVKTNTFGIESIQVWRYCREFST